MNTSYSFERGRCLACGRILGLFRKLVNKHFCCNDHEQQYLEEMRALTITRLRCGFGFESAASRDVNA